MKNYLKIFCAVLFLSFSGCKKENLCDCFKSTGADIIVPRDITATFDTIYVKDKVDVYLVEDSVYKIEVHGGKHVAHLVHTDINNNKLVISNHNKCNFVRSYKRRVAVYVHSPNIRWIVQNGVGNIYSVNTITTDTITYQIFNSGDIHLKVNTVFLQGGVNGMGDIYAEGTAVTHNTNVKGEGFIEAENLNTNTSDMILKTSGTTKITALTSIILTLENSGNVYYHGSPAVIQTTITGSGKLIPF